MNDNPGYLVGKGLVVDAQYLPQEVPAYQNNPLIEALPPIWAMDEAIELLSYYPAWDEEDRGRPAHLKLHLLQSTLQFFDPFPQSLELEQRISRMLRTGLQARNPWDPRFVSSLHQQVPLYFRSTATGFALIGMTGVGKSTTLERNLSLYPQGIRHHVYKDRPLTMVQVVWLKLDCPFDGSIKGLCINFFEAMDDIIGSDYADVAGKIVWHARFK